MDYASIVIMGIAVTFLVYGSLALNKTNQTDSKSAKEASFRAEAAVVKIDGLVNANIKSVGDNNQKVQSCVVMIESLNKVCQDLSASIAKSANSYLELQQKQIELQEKLSNKRPIIKMVSSDQDKKGKGISSIIKSTAKKSKELEA